MRRIARRVFAAVVALPIVVGVWIGVDLLRPSRHSLTAFDAHEVARLETAMWRSYYDHRPVRLLVQLDDLLRGEYHLPYWRSWLAAYYAARSAEVFQAGHNRADHMRALPALRKYYALILNSSTTPFDADRAARAELEWWIIHRERAQYGARPLEQALSELQSRIYELPANRFEEHSRARAEAMLLRDERAEAGVVSEDDWGRIEELLDISWSSLRNVVSGHEAQSLREPSENH